MLYMSNVVWVPARREDVITEERQYRSGPELSHQFLVALQLDQLHLQGCPGVVQGEVKGAGEQLEVRGEGPDSCETGGEFLPQRGEGTYASVQVHVVNGTSS